MHKTRYVGVHLSIAGGVHNALKKAISLKINAIQIFLKNPNRWKSPYYNELDIKHFHSILSEMNDLRIFAHSGYLINLASDGENLHKSIETIIDDINRAEALGIGYIVIHPGSHKDIGEEAAIIRIADSLDRIFQEKENSNVKILLETSSGQGTSIGYRFEHLRDIISYSRQSDRLYVCLDTCHIFTAGYIISDIEGYEEVISEFIKVIGIDRLRLIHVNDSKKEGGSRIDRHEHIGDGYIGDTGFKNLLNDDRLKHIPLILETPKFNNVEADTMNLRRIYAYIDQYNISPTKSNQC